MGLFTVKTQCSSDSILIIKVIVFTFLIAATCTEKVVEKDTKEIFVGKNITVKCVSNYINVTWKDEDGKILQKNVRFSFLTSEIKNEESENEISISTYKYEHSLSINNIQLSDKGIYKCELSDNETSKEFTIVPVLPAKIVASTNDKVKQKIGRGVTLFCVVEISPYNRTGLKLQWLKDEKSFDFLDKYISVNELNNTHINYTLELAEVYKKENGSYACVIYTKDEIVRKDIALLVMDVPKVSIDFVKAVGANKIYLNWTVNDGNDPIQKYFIQYRQEGAKTFTYYDHVIGGKNTSYVLENFHPNTSYLLRISAKNSIGDSTPSEYNSAVRTLERDPFFIPKVETTGSTPSTITIGWDPPIVELLEYVQYYELVVAEAGEVPKIVEEAIYQQNSRNLPYMFDNLKASTEYEFKVRACSDLTKLCGPWSDVVNGTTMDGIASKPTDINVTCSHNNNHRHNSVFVSWNAPKTPNGKIVSYDIHLEGLSTYKFDGQLKNETWGPKTRRVEEPQHKTIYNGVSPNTNYTVTVSAITRHKRAGEPAVGKCSMPVAVPETISRVMWTKVETTEKKCVLKLYISKISERNGPICCYRLYLVRMGKLTTELPSPEKLNISTYHEVHNPNNTAGGAYIAEMLAGDYFRSEIFLGDGKRFFENQNSNIEEMDKACRQCLEGQPFLRRVKLNDPSQPLSSTDLPQVPILSEKSREELMKADNLTKTASKILENRRKKRNNIPLEAISHLKYDKHLTNHTNDAEIIDGEIDMNSNYTGFLEVIVREKDTILTAYSNYFEIITPGTIAEQFNSSDDVTIILNVTIQILAVFGIVLVLLIVLCFLHHYNSKHSGPGDEVISLRDSLSKALFGGRTGNHRHFIGTSLGKASDVGPIHKSNLYIAYKNRHKDTDYGFLHEYEMLPNRFSDRTTKNSDLKENSLKNRYPDIKAYDQTRVRLSQINGIQGSDYINANFVIGYKERKKFICAQGPMECTVNDFWRMIWEQHLEIIVMLTNLEEYNKSKCAKYWPEKVSDLKQFGDISVKFVTENKLGDYIIRNLDVCRRMTMNEDEEERRQITQYHYLVWKDFMAPEHPQGIIKFVRHINAVYSVQRGPILVHCSAGVGRTGTLVALDSLMQQLEEEGQVSIFNTVCDLRHQRNFLVQSLKQYIFLYRALLDTAHFGNTEISATSMSMTIENLKNKPADGLCKLEVEFEKLLSVTEEINKTSTVGCNDANMSKNRSEAVIPYDRNRVILTPIPLKENSTYINASFIEGYDNSEIYIIAQDPLENTIGDFWRMISEQSITTLVMISEIGDGPRRCPRYWADDEIQYDHILVKYVNSESCPYYTRREFDVTNCKIDDTIKVTQFQYNGWPTVDGEVPEVCRGIIELVYQAQNHHSKNKNAGCQSPLTVHCSLGTDRSSIFVAVCILVQQLRTEKSVDICSTARKIRCQRPQLLNTYAQYEFLHRAIANYADLHKLSTDSSDC